MNYLFGWTFDGSHFAGGRPLDNVQLSHANEELAAWGNPCDLPLCVLSQLEMSESTPTANCHYAVLFSALA